MRSPSQRCRLSIDERYAAEARRVDDQPRRRLDGARLGDVERDQAAEAGVADVLDRRDERAGARRSRSPTRCGAASARSSVSSPRSSAAAASGEAVMPALTRSSRSRVGVRCARDRRAEQRVVVAGQELRRRVHDDVGAFVERAQVDRRRDGRVADDQAGVRRAERPSSAASASGSPATRPRRCRPRAARPPGRTRRGGSRTARAGRSACPVPKYAPSASAIGRAGAGEARGARSSSRPSRTRRGARRRPRARPASCSAATPFGWS